MDDLLNLISSDSQYVIKRSGDTVLFEQDKIKRAVLKAMESVDSVDVDMAEKIARLTKKVYSEVINIVYPMLMRFTTWLRINLWIMD